MKLNIKTLRGLVALAIVVFMFSCKVQQRAPLPVYIEKMRDTTGIVTTKGEYHFRIDDALTVQIISESTYPGVDDIYNCNTTVTSATGTESSGTGKSSGVPRQSGGCSFIIGPDGNIHHPRLGVFKAAGLTREQLAASVKARLDNKQVLINPTVTVLTNGFTYSVLGEVKKEDNFVTTGDKINLFQAIASAGGITDYGDKKHIKIIREDAGKKELGLVDITTKEVFDSPYFHLVQNDIIVIAPTEQKYLDLDKQERLQKVAMLNVIVTSMGLLFNLFR